jgi:hypothetical protein
MPLFLFVSDQYDRFLIGRSNLMILLFCTLLIFFLFSIGSTAPINIVLLLQVLSLFAQSFAIPTNTFDFCFNI